MTQVQAQPENRRVIVMDDDQLQRWRQDLINSTHLSYSELNEYAEEWMLRGDERDKWETIRSINFLLGDEPADG